MATTFLEPGGDATFNVTLTSAGGYWANLSSAAIATDFVNTSGGHVKSISFPVAAATSNYVVTPDGVISNTGARISFYFYLVALPTAIHALTNFCDAGNGVVRASLKMTTTGVLQLWNGASIAQVGTDGATLSTGQWYRISLATVLTSTSVNELRLFVNGTLSISVTNATFTNVAVSDWVIGDKNVAGDATWSARVSDLYADNSSSLVDTGNILVTAKRPFSNGTTNGFTTQIGSGGSGYGTGHTPQVNERALSTTNGWSMVGAGSAVIEEYNIEPISTGDFNPANYSIVDYMGWVYTSSLVSETINIILNGVNFSQAITSTNTMYQKYAGAVSYPSGAGADIGIQTDTSLTTVSLFECGVVIAYRDRGGASANTAPYVRVGAGMSRSERAT